MVIKRLQKLLTVPFFIWGCGFLYATEPPPNSVIVISSQTVTTGFEKVYFLSIPTTEEPIEMQQKAFIYIASDAVFDFPEEVFRQVVVIHIPKIKPSKIKFIALSKTNKSDEASEKLVYEQQSPNPFRNFPYHNRQQFLLCGSVIVPASKDGEILTAKVVSAFVFNCLPSLWQHCQPIFSDVACLSSCESLQAHTTRPPPVC